MKNQKTKTKKEINKWIFGLHSKCDLCVFVHVLMLMFVSVCEIITFYHFFFFLYSLFHSLWELKQKMIKKNISKWIDKNCAIPFFFANYKHCKVEWTKHAHFDSHQFKFDVGQMENRFFFFFLSVHMCWTWANWISNEIIR